jgi:hypothetical protein
MPNFEQIPMNEEIEDTKTEKEDNENNKKKSGWIGRTIRNTAAGVLLAAGVGETLPAESAEAKFADKTLDINGEMLDSVKTKELGSPLGIEAEQDDLELRTFSLNQLGISMKDLQNEWLMYFNKEKHSYKGNWGDVKGRSAHAQMFSDFVSKKVEKICGKRCFVMTDKESKEISDQYKKRAENEDQAPQTYIDQREVVDGETETSFVVNRSKRSSTGALEFTHVHSNNFPFHDENGSPIELVIKIQK